METEDQAVAAPQRVWRVLVVDDEQNLNWSLVNSLRREQYAADGALTAEDARRRLTEQSYDCVISDVKMPGIDGFQLLSWLREWRPSTRVIMMTAFGSPSVRQEAFRNGVIAYLEKPFDLRVLKAELRRTLEARPAQPNHYDLIDITQAINVGRRDIVAQVVAGGQMGRLAFENGDLYSAEYGDLRGDEAFQAMCAAPAQRIWQVTPPEPPERNVTKPVSALIFDALLARNTAPASAEPPASPAAPRITSQPQPVQTTTGQMRTAEQAMSQAQRALSGLVVTIGAPCAVALLSPAGDVKAQAQTVQPPLTEEVFAHLAQAMQAAARAARAGHWGGVREARLITGERQALVRLLNSSVEALALVVVAPVQLDTRQLEAAVAAHESSLRSLTSL
ncbi:MAG TPA: response regulator [Ktedonobacterales bacterium]